MTDQEKPAVEQKVKNALAQIRPYLQQDGGDPYKYEREGVQKEYDPLYRIVFCVLYDDLPAAPENCRKDREEYCEPKRKIDVCHLLLPV